MAAMQAFLADYPVGLVEGRYLNVLALGVAIVPYLERSLDPACSWPQSID